MTDFGSGPFLSRELDFEVTTTGDIRAVSGIEELEKDLGFQTIIRMRNLTGATQTNRTEARIRSRVNAILSADPRIDEVIETKIRFLPKENEAEVITNVKSDNTNQELVFNI